MADETQTTEVVEVIQTVETSPEVAPAAEPARDIVPAAEPAIDWDAAPAYEQTVVEETTVAPTVATTYSEQTDVTTYAAPRGAWDFTESQRIVIGFMLWLNILVLVTGYLAVTGQLTI